MLDSNILLILYVKGLIHSSIVISLLAVIASITLVATEELITALSLTKRPADVHEAPEGLFIVRSNGVPKPEMSCIVVPLPSSKLYKAISPPVTLLFVAVTYNIAASLVSLGFTPSETTTLY